MLENVRKRSAYLLLAHTSAIGGNAGAHFILASLVNPEVYGSLLFFVMAFNFISLTAMFGFQHILLHQAPRMAERKDYKALSDLTYDSWSVCTSVALLCSVLLACWHYFITPIPMIGADWAVLALLIITPLWALIRIMAHLLLARGATFSGVFPDQGMQAIGLIIIVPLGLFGLANLDNVPLLLTGLILSGILGVAISLYYVWVYFPQIGQYKFRLWKPVKEWHKLSLPFFGFSVLQQALERIDLFLLGILMGPRELAIYAIAQRLSQLVTFPAIASKAALAPRFSSLFEKGDRKSLIKLLTISTLILTGLAIIGAAIIYVLGPFILGLLDETYASESMAILLVMLGAEIVICIFTPLKVKMLMGESQVFLSRLFAVAVLGNLMANLYFIPLYGIEAAAIIRLVTQTGLYSVMGLGFAQMMQSSKITA